jgi:Protein of unknown function (DUF2971)
MNDTALMQLFQPLYADLPRENAFDKMKPLLAHYTTTQTLEKILTSNEVWFSNPLFMNDMEEVRFGILQGNALVMNSEIVATACKTEDRTKLFRQHFTSYFDRFANQHVLDTYVFCLSRHERNDDDGILSMWRGYGANGNGVAIVFDTAQLNVIENSPLLIADVTYATTNARMDWLNKLLSVFQNILTVSDIPTDKLYLAAYSLFERIKLFALFTKHHGFKEEKEWRVVYLPDRDTEKKLEKMFNYSLGPRGIEPKLRFKVLPIKGVTADDLSISKITDRIILGPSVSSPIAAATVLRMFDMLSQSALKSKLRTSTIPFRAIV